MLCRPCHRPAVCFRHLLVNVLAVPQKKKTDGVPKILSLFQYIVFFFLTLCKSYNICISHFLAPAFSLYLCYFGVINSGHKITILQCKTNIKIIYKINVHLSGMLCAVNERMVRTKQLLSVNKTWKVAQSSIITKRPSPIQNIKFIIQDIYRVSSHAFRF